MSDLEMMGEWYLFKNFEDFKKGREPVAEDLSYFHEELAKWEEEDDAVIDEWEDLKKRKDNDSEWEEVG